MSVRRRRGQGAVAAAKVRVSGEAVNGSGGGRRRDRCGSVGFGGIGGSGVALFIFNPCVYTLSSSTASLMTARQRVSLNVSGGCAWAATSSAAGGHPRFVRCRLRNVACAARRSTGFARLTLTLMNRVFTVTQAPGADDPLITWTDIRRGIGAAQALAMMPCSAFSMNNDAIVTFKGVAGGGAGAYGDPFDGHSYGGGGGGAGATTTGTTVALSTGKTYTLTVGAGGANNAVDGGDGGATTLVNTTDGVVLVSLSGGRGGWAAQIGSDGYAIRGGAGAGGVLAVGTNGVPGGAGVIRVRRTYRSEARRWRRRRRRALGGAVRRSGANGRTGTRRVGLAIGTVLARRRCSGFGGNNAGGGGGGGGGGTVRSQRSRDWLQRRRWRRRPIPAYNYGAGGPGGNGVGVLVYVACGVSLSPTSVNTVVGATSGTLTVTAPSRCTWTATSSAPWLTIAAGATGTGVGTITYATTPNTSGIARTASITVNYRTVSVTQAAGLSTDPVITWTGPTSGSRDFDIVGGTTFSAPGTYTFTVSRPMNVAFRGTAGGGGGAAGMVGGGAPGGSGGGGGNNGGNVWLVLTRPSRDGRRRRFWRLGRRGRHQQHGDGGADGTMTVGRRPHVAWQTPRHSDQHSQRRGR